MAPRCRLLADGVPVEATWRREGEHLVVSPANGVPRSLPLGEVCGIAGDGFALQLRSALGDLSLDRLGADGPTLLQALRRDWLPLRAGRLRLSDGQPPAQVFAAHLQTPSGAGPCRGFLADDRFVYAPDGGDVAALPLADWRSVEFDDAAFCLRATAWDGGSAAVLSKLGGETAALHGLLRDARGRLAAEADASLASHLPQLAPGARAALAAHWLPGRLLGMAELERVAPGFEAAFREAWLAHSPRAAEGTALMAGVAADGRWLGYGRPGRTLAPQDLPDTPQLLWLLVRGEPAWSLELLSQGDYATYLFEGGAELPALIGGLVQLPEFSREALYLPLADLVEQRSRYAVAARDLPLLRELRARFAGRRIHAPRPAAAAGGRDP